MFGGQRGQPGILIEPSLENGIDVSNDDEGSRFRNRIWYVQKRFGFYSSLINCPQACH